MHRFYLPPDACANSVLTLSEREAHHAVSVLRIRQAERVIVLDGAGSEMLCDVRSVDRQGVCLTVRQRSLIPALPYRLTLLQAIPKGKAMDAVVQKATELGAHRIVPIQSERTVSQLEEESAAHKVEKWKAITIEAIKQCGSAWLTEVELPMTPSTFLARGEKFDLSLIATLQSDARHPRKHFESFFADRHRAPLSVCVWVGPEGDFTPAEINAIRSAGALPITLGQLVLRSETAAIYCLSVLNYELQSLAG